MNFGSILDVFKHLPDYSSFTAIEALLIFLGGGFGGFVATIANEHKKEKIILALPRIEDGNLVLGFLAPIFVGGIMGVVVDRSFMNAAIGAFLVMGAPYIWDVCKNIIVEILSSMLNNLNNQGGNNSNG